jgi:hypothetical protein
MTLVPAARELFEKSVKVQILPKEDLYGGKICAALDRQHPRDLFDVRILLDNEGISDKIRNAFIVYLISHNRPMNELLNPIFQDLSQQYTAEFAGLTIAPITLDDLINAREQLLARLISGLTEKEKKFIISVKAKNPDWDLMKDEHIKNLPAVQWKLLNLEKMDEKNHKQALAKLIKILE